MVKPKALAQLLSHAHQFTDSASYYPELTRKGKRAILLDQIREVLKHGAINKYYFTYGLDVKSRAEIDLYFNYAPFMAIRNALNQREKFNATPVLRDKLLFGMYASSLGVNTPKNLALIHRDSAYNLSTNQETDTISFLENLKGDFFFKLINGECGNNIFHVVADSGSLRVNDENISANELKLKMGTGKFLVQKTVLQHPLMSSLHPQSLNTIRLVTIKGTKSGKISVLPSILRIGTGQSVVDNTSQGGLAVGINMDSGKLKEYGFFKPEYGTKIAIHPQSNIIFSQFTIPYFSEAVAMAKRLHGMLNGVVSIGWDVAISPDGPTFIEGNDNWEINGPQICNGPLKEAFYKNAELTPKADWGGG